MAFFKIARGTKSVIDALPIVDGTLLYTTTEDGYIYADNGSSRITLSSQLNANKTVYVATTGSDVTGDGTSGNPYKTITMGVNSIPKALNGYDGAVVVANGTYTEVVNVLDFYGGELKILLNSGGNVTLNGGFYALDTSIFTITTVSGTATMTINPTSTIGAITSEAETWARVLNTTITIDGGGTREGVRVIGSRFYGTTIACNNCTNGILSDATSNTYVVSLSGTGNTNGVNTNRGGSFGFGTSTISATNPYVQQNGGAITSTISEMPTTSNLGTVTTILVQRNGGTCRFKLVANTTSWTINTSYTLCTLTSTFRPTVGFKKAIMLSDFFGILTISTSGVVSVLSKSTVSANAITIDETFII